MVPFGGAYNGYRGLRIINQGLKSNHSFEKHMRNVDIGIPKQILVLFLDI